MPPRAVTVLCLIQIMAVAFAYLIAGRFLRLAESVFGEPLWASYPWLVRARSWGLFALLIPVVTAVAAVRWRDRLAFDASITSGGFLLVLLITAAVVAGAVIWAFAGLSYMNYTPRPRFS